MNGSPYKHIHTQKSFKCLSQNFSELQSTWGVYVWLCLVFGGSGKIFSVRFGSVSEKIGSFQFQELE